MKQTAVDWLAEKYNYVTWLRNRDEISAKQGDEMRAHYLADAKEMEKQQIKEAFKAGAFHPGYELESEQYYWENYENE